MRTMHTITRVTRLRASASELRASTPASRFVARLLVIAFCGLLLSGTALRAQVGSAPSSANASQDAASVAANLHAPAPAESPAPIASAIAGIAASETGRRGVAPVRRSSRSVFASLYVGLAATHALDVHSTLRALDA